MHTFFKKTIKATIVLLVIVAVAAFALWWLGRGRTEALRWENRWLKRENEELKSRNKTIEDELGRLRKSEERARTRLSSYEADDKAKNLAAAQVNLLKRLALVEGGFSNDERIALVRFMLAKNDLPSPERLRLIEGALEPPRMRERLSGLLHADVLSGVPVTELQKILEGLVAVAKADGEVTEAEKEFARKEFCDKYGLKEPEWK